MISLQKAEPPTGAVEFTYQEMRSMMLGYSPVNRKIIFFVLAYQKADRTYPTQALIASQIGVSRITINTRIMQMDRDGIIRKVERGVRWTAKGNPCGQPCQYIVRVGKRKATSPWLSDIESVQVSMPMLDEDFTAAYWLAVHAMFGHLRLSALMTKKEYAEYKDIILRTEA